MTRHQILKSVLAGLLASACGQAAQAEPASGYIATSEYSVNKDGVAVGQKRTQKIWFEGHNTRIESLIGKDVVDVVVGGDNSWSAAPAAGRLLFPNVPRDVNGAAPPTYPAIARRSFARFFAERAQAGKEEIKGVPCWKYQWREEAVNLGDIAMAAHNVTYWLYADAEFPLALARKTDLGGVQELLEFQLNAPVPPGFFTPPINLTPVRPFQLPQSKFLIEFQENRQSTQYGWKVHSTDVFKGDGENVTRTYVQTTTAKDGKVTPFAPPVTTINYEQAREEIGNRLQTASWMSVRKTGREPILNTVADVLENIIEGLPEEKSWVADHALLGTVCLRRVTKMPGDISERGVTKLEIEAPPVKP